MLGSPSLHVCVAAPPEATHGRESVEPAAAPLLFHAFTSQSSVILISSMHCSLPASPLFPSDQKDSGGQRSLSLGKE